MNARSLHCPFALVVVRTMTAALLAAVSTLSQKHRGKDQQSILEIEVEPFLQGRLLLRQPIGVSTRVAPVGIFPGFGHRFFT